MAPPARGVPLIVSRELIEVFEKNNPALAGIGAIMLDEGHWVLEGGENGETVSAPDKAHTTDEKLQHGEAANAFRHLYAGQA